MTDAPDIRIVDVPERARYELLVDGRPAGLVTYRRQPGEITFVHSQIDAAYEGHGLGGRLAQYVLDEARDAGLAVHPVCPFIRSYIEQHPEYADLVAIAPE